MYHYNMMKSSIFAFSFVNYIRETCVTTATFKQKHRQKIHLIITFQMITTHWMCHDTACISRSTDTCTHVRVHFNARIFAQEHKKKQVMAHLHYLAFIN